MRTGTSPDIFGYLSYREFLGDWFAAQKAADRRYSHRLFARRANVRSPSLLGEVISGRRNLTPATAEGFCRAMRLSHDQARFFDDLVRFDQAAPTELKNQAWQRIAASRRFRNARPVDEGMMRYLSNWHYPAVRELAWRADFQADPAWIAAELQPQITVAQARDALDTLVELGMLQQREVHGVERLAPAEVSLATAHQLAPLAAVNYHHGMLDRAKDALDQVPGAQRHLCAVTVAIPEDLVPVLKAELDAFQERMLHLCDEQIDRAERVYQLNLQLFPLSAPAGAPTGSED